jgi:hypothetical protein
MLLLELLAAGATATPLPNERTILVRVIESPAVVRNEIQVDGLLCDQNYNAAKCDEPIRVRLRKGSNRLSVRITIQGKEALVADVPLSRFPNLDMQSVLIHGYYTPRISILLRLRFGEPDYHCYQNDDGRGTLDIDLDEGEPAEIYVTTYPDCEIQTVELSEELSAE